MSESFKGHEKSGESHIPHHEAKEHHERLKQHHEKAAERAKDANKEVDQLAKKVEQHAVAKEDYIKAEKPVRAEEHMRTKQDKDHSFETTMHHVRQNMSKPERAFSSFIHKPAVEKTSEVLGKTIARPSGIAGATIAAFIGLLSVYSIAKFAGFELSGSEMPLLLAIGFVAGLVIEWAFKSLRVIISPKKS